MRAMQAVAETMMARDGKSPQLRLLVPTPLCGSIIGKGGATIRSFAEDSQAAITVSPQAKLSPRPKITPSAAEAHSAWDPVCLKRALIKRCTAAA